jgi:hypothetical protein
MCERLLAGLEEYSLDVGRTMAVIFGLHAATFGILAVVSWTRGGSPGDEGDEGKEEKDEDEEADEDEDGFPLSRIMHERPFWRRFVRR